MTHDRCARLAARAAADAAFHLKAAQRAETLQAERRHAQRARSAAKMARMYERECQEFGLSA